MKIMDAVEPMNEEAGPRWSFMRVRRIRGRDGSTYLWRLYILSTPWFGLMLHRIFRPDRQRDLHDHPWPFLSIILRGWYSESWQRGQDATCFSVRRWWNYKLAQDRHSIREVGRVPVWTLVFTGVRQRVWGFWVERACDCGCQNFTPTQHRAFCSRYGVLVGWEGRHRWVDFKQYEKLNDA